MSRSFDSSPSRSERTQAPVGNSGALRERPEDQRSESKTVYQFNARNYHLNPNQESMLRDIGMFRTVTTQSLRKYIYYDDKDQTGKGSPQFA